MRNFYRRFPFDSLSCENIPIPRHFLSHHSRVPTRFRSATKIPASSSSSSKDTRAKSPALLPLYQEITELVAEKPTVDGEASFRKPVAENGSSSACQIARESERSLNAKQQAQAKNSEFEDVSPIVQRVTEIVRLEKSEIRMGQRLDELGLSFSSEIVEKVLKRCFKVGHLALRFFNWVKLQPGFCHTTQTYNVMIYIAGEAEEIDLMEKLMNEMEDELCTKDIKTWTTLISYYGKAKQIGKALSTFEAMRKSGCEPDAGVYKAILRALFNVRKAELSMEFYKEMVSKNMLVDASLYQLLMSCLARSGDVTAVRLVGDDMIKIAKLSESQVYTCILRSFCITGRIEDARHLFEEIKKKNLLVDLKVSEVLVKGLCRASKMDDAIEIVNNMKQSSAIDCRVYGCLLDGFIRQGDVTKALQLLHDMRELGCLPMVSSYTQMIQYLFRLDEYGKACELYEKMLKDGIEPDIVAITAMVAGHVRHNQISEAWVAFEGMKKKGMKPTWKAYAVFIKELCKASKPNEAYNLLKEMLDSDMNATDGIYRLVISSLTRNGELEKARKVEQMQTSLKLQSLGNKMVCQSADHPSCHEEHKRSNCSFNQDINYTQKAEAYSETDFKEVCRILSSSTNWNSIYEVLERSMIHFTPVLVEAVLRSYHSHSGAALRFFSWVGNQSGYEHTAETYNMAIKLAGSAKDFKHMRYLCQEMRRSGCSVTPNTWTIMIAQYGQAGLTEIALRTFKDMKSDGYQPNGSTYKYLILFLCGKKGRKVDEAIKFFQEMIHVGYMPDKELLGFYLSSLCESGKLMDAKGSVKSLCKRGFAKELGYSLLIKSLCRAGKVEEALILTEEMDKVGCSVDQYIYGSLVHALLRQGRLDEALDKLERMKEAGLSQTVHIHTSLIVHFCKEKQIRKAVDIFKKMREDGYEPTVVTYSALIRGYMNMGMISDAWEIFHWMKLKGPFPDFETYSMFMTCLCKVGRSEDGLKLINEMLECGIIPSAVNFRTVFHGLNREGKQELAHSVLQTKWLLKRERMFMY
uniref:Pentatricopeptide repeat-containing protein At5g06400, mitochondrial n=1 Tax=Elaeis guineensis var. tenera TaxID=51953 RepID=A0A6I9SG20_ELAGV|nr:putative pentatricopeptide repeat-containing protein At5g06400, mitochondrial [Elaeis guineensis]